MYCKILFTTILFFISTLKHEVNSQSTVSQQNEDIVDRLSPYTDFHLSTSRLSKLSLENVNQIPSSIHLNTNIYGNRIDDDLYIVNALYSKNTRVHVYNNNNEIVKNGSIELRSYHAKLVKYDGWCTVTVHDNSTFRGVFYLNSKLYQVDLTSDLVTNSTKKDRVATLSQSGMTIVRHEDIKTEHSSCGSELHVLPKMNNHDDLLDFKNTSNLSNLKMVTLVDRWYDCYPGDNVPNQISIGVAVDAGFYQSFGSEGSVRSYIANMFTTMNAITIAQFNVYFTVIDIIIYTETGANTPVWNKKPGSIARCNTTIDQTLTDFSAWKYANQRSKNSLWTLLTNCFPSQTIGLAYINTLCDQYYSTSVVSKTATTWLTTLHEIGHTLAATHTFQLGQKKTGSIMDYGDNSWKGTIQFADVYSKSQICGSFTRAKNVNYISPFCISPYSTKCGNGIIEQGEDCDDSSSCCVNCKFAANAQCSGVNTGCCSGDCKYLPTSTMCSKTGYCSNNICKESICGSYNGLSFCGVNPTNTCRQRCQSGTSCTDSFSVPNLNIDDGIVCSYNGVLSVCKGGICIPPNNTPTNVITTNSKTQLLTGIDIVGQDVTNVVVTETECQNILSNDAKYSLAVYQKSTSKCFLKSDGVNIGIFTPALNAYVKVGKNIQIKNIDFYGNDFNSYSGTDLLKCRNDCVSNVTCFGVIFYQNRCYFKNKLDNARRLDNAIFLVN